MSEHSVVDAMKTIIERFGPTILIDSRKSLSMLKDLAPSHNNEIILLKHAFDNNLLEALVNANSFDEQKRAIMRMYYTLTSVLRLSEDAADEICNVFVKALDLDVCLIQSHSIKDNTSIQKESSTVEKRIDNNVKSVSSSNINSTKYNNTNNNSINVDDEIYALDNSVLRNAIDSMRANFNNDTQNKVINTALRSRFIIPYIGNNSNPERYILITNNKNNNKLIPVFLDYSELEKSQKILQNAAGYIIIKFGDIANFIEKADKSVDGFVIDPMTHNLPFTRQMLMSIKDVLIKHQNSKK